MNRKFFIAGLVILLAGCSHYSLKKADTHKIGSSYAIQTPVEWNKFNQSKVEIWTRDGTVLNELTLFEGISEGNTLFPIPYWDKKQLALAPKFAPGMRANDVMEFVLASFSQRKVDAIEGHNLRPANFGSLRGFRFEVTYVNQPGMEMKGMLIGAIEEDKLHLVMFNAPKLHFFDRDKELVEQIMGSIEII